MAQHLDLVHMGHADAPVNSQIQDEHVRAIAQRCPLLRVLTVQLPVSHWCLVYATVTRTLTCFSRLADDASRRLGRPVGSHRTVEPPATPRHTVSSTHYLLMLILLLTARVLHAVVSQRRRQTHLVTPDRGPGTLAVVQPSMERLCLAACTNVTRVTLDARAATLRYARGTPWSV